ncbi:low affinity immunoglobulin epsilon Fc receptor-like [Bradysia coprophila]|uniref:low affinity immunoglobulin epsilon Fc receptor-like n=1 Tax=Bradysia coprophila TaxID=38358 RepID=UPI00187D936B|nr:low affinity immunoglobulin epsilon Fc receptor-like [Bradysia coprophila]
MARLLVLLFCISIATTQRNGNIVKDRGAPSPDELREIQRQNKITAQILENFLERRLFPNKRPTHKLPTLHDILPKSAVDVKAQEHRVPIKRNNNDYNIDGDNDDPEYQDLDRDPESLQSVESEHVDSYYDDFLAIKQEILNDQTCASHVDWSMPLLKFGEKRYYLGVFFKANWYKAAQYCRFHGMHLASISSQEENDNLEKHIKDFGFGNDHFWTSGTDLADEGNFFWMANGRPITFTNWNAGEPNNFRYENGEEENCMELWNRDGKGLKWNDSPCSFETYFVCEVQ